jgi:histidinol-phosphate aminotransferase
VNSLAQRAALAALEDEEHVALSRAMNQAEMATVRAGLGALGLHPVPSDANFLFFDAGRDGREVFEALLREGVIVRHIAGRMLRVTIGLPEENQRFLQGLKKVLAPSIVK